MRIETIEESSIGWVASAEHGGRKLEIHVFGHPPSSISLELFESDRRLTRQAMNVEPRPLALRAMRRRAIDLAGRLLGVR